MSMDSSPERAPPTSTVPPEAFTRPPCSHISESAFSRRVPEFENRLLVAPAQPVRRLPTVVVPVLTIVDCQMNTPFGICRVPSFWKRPDGWRHSVSQTTVPPGPFVNVPRRSAVLPETCGPSNRTRPVLLNVTWDLKSPV